EMDAGAISVVENSIRSCAVLTESLQRLPDSKVSSSSKATLSRLIHSEAGFLRKLSSGQIISTKSSFSLNIGHLEAVVHLLLQPFVSGVSRVCKPVRFSSSETVYVDIVCSLNGNPVWLIVSDRNPRYVTWNCDEKKGLKRKVLQIVDAANRIDAESSMTDDPLFCGKLPDSDLGPSFRSLLSAMKCWCCCCCSSGNTVEEHGLGFLNLVNFDTTALVAIVSGISNDGAEELLSTSEKELRARFKGNYEFVIEQAKSEIRSRIHVTLSGVVSGKRGIICESVCSEFKGLISMCGGPNEKLRAQYVLDFIR
ncbi:hypothetical protein M569_13312, partial [Genlisea aurea]